MSITDIASATKTVALGSAAVEVTGLSLRKLTKFIIEYPEFLDLLAGKIDLATMVVKAPNMALAMFAVSHTGLARERIWGRRQVDDEALLSAFDHAAFGQQIDILSAIYDLTFKGERAVPFLKSVTALLAVSTQNSGPEPEQDAQTESPISDEVGPKPSSD